MGLPRQTMAKKKSQLNANIPPENKTMRPYMVKGMNPPFHELGEYTFQDLSAELLAEEPDITHSRVFGDRGQTQYRHECGRMRSDRVVQDRGYR